MANHTIGETVAFLSALSFVRVQNSISDINVTRSYQIIGAGRSVIGAPVTPFVNTGASLKPWQPVHISATRDGSGNITITFYRRTRINGEWKDFVDVPLGELEERYEVDILDGTTVKRTLESTTTSVVYTDADQITDFGSTQSSVNINVYQMSNQVGRGYPGPATV
jgi:hypothetical protein